MLTSRRNLLLRDHQPVLRLMGSWKGCSIAAQWPAAGADAWAGMPANHSISRANSADIEVTGESLLFGRDVVSVEHGTSGGAGSDGNGGAAGW